MGAPKQKWTAEEEAALKAGIVKHGAGKWRTILLDPEFSDVLRLRSNVDLKDKWRNLNVMTNGFGSRDKSKLLTRRIIQVPKHEIDNLALSNDIRTNEEIYEIKPLAVSGALQIEAPKRTVIRWEDRILEAIATLDDPGGSNRTEIGAYIEEHYSAPPNFTRLLSENLKVLIAGRRLIKVKHKYRIPKTFASSDKASLICHLEGSQRVPLKVDKEDISIPTKSQIDSDLSKMKSMNPEEAAAFAARAVAEAEAAIAEAEAAEREADAAEADAEAAKVLEEAAMKTLKGGRSMLNMMIQAS